MYLRESIPGVQGPKHEIALVRKTVDQWAIGVLGLTSGETAMLVGSRATFGSYISDAMYDYNVTQICDDRRVQRELIRLYPSLNLEARRHGLTAKTLTELAQLPQYRHYSGILVPVLQSAASDWDIMFPGFMDDGSIAIPDTGTAVEIHPYSR